MSQVVLVHPGNGRQLDLFRFMVSPLINKASSVLTTDEEAQAFNPKWGCHPGGGLVSLTHPAIK